jgi:hypothetical protein
MEGKMVDRYTKGVLTIIAICLAIIAAKGLPFLRTATAQSGPVHVVVDEFRSGVFNYAFQFVQAPLPVKVEH